jgi:CDP-diacylglycerol---serine O-phosphatidyltransferase
MQPEDEGYDKRTGTFRPVPVRYLLPNLVTLVALCSGVTAIRLAFEGRFEVAVAAIILAIFLDAVDGRLARYLQGTSRFGAELDSLADFVNFGVAPAIMIYMWSLIALKPMGWVVALMLAIACALRLARFNVALEDPNKPPYAHSYFAGVPAPAGAGLAMVPFYLGFVGVVENGREWAIYVGPWVVIVAVLMVSRVPTFSFKTVSRVPRELVLPILAGAALVIACLINFPWETLVAFGIIYMALIPWSAFKYLRQKKEHAASAVPPTDAAP